MLSIAPLHAQEPVLQDFSPQFSVIYRPDDPGLALRPAGISHVSYNVPTWEAYRNKSSDLVNVHIDSATGGDGFDDRILKGNTSKRTVDIFDAGRVIHVRGAVYRRNGDTTFYKFPDQDLFSLEAYTIGNGKPYPLLHFKLITRRQGWFSVGYVGAPATGPSEAKEIWQPLIWQEKRLPDKRYLTMAYRAPIPTTLVFDGHRTIGVVASSAEYPFDPLPLFENSRFGVMLRDEAGKMQPQLFAPVLGGMDSKMPAGRMYTFNAYLVAQNEGLTQTYEDIARRLYGFKDYRRNDISSLNTALDRIAQYALSPYAWFIDSLKGCAYSTDVPGAVKNVSSLNPLELAVVMDDDSLFEKRAFPVMEYMLSREKFLFALDSTQKIQSPSRKLNGPVAPLSELVSLYDVFHKDQQFLLQMARSTFKTTKVRNLDVVQKGNTWWNAMYLYMATGEKQLLKAAERGADAYIKARIDKKAASFKDPYAGSLFFWDAFTSRWTELLQLYEITHEPRYLQAARDGARHFAMFTWMSPQIPDRFVLVNKGGEAPMYWYLKQKGHRRMYYPEEWAPAWRLSATGLTSESSGTSSGHRAIFMANFAPWMLRLGYYAKDTFLMDIAKAAVIGRYRSFPGYHINTARTTAYEKADFPYHQFMDQSVTSFHYNHIMPMASMLIDYLVSDVLVRSGGKISFPAEYIEGYAYLKNNFYGSHLGRWYDEDSVQLWMPSGLLRLDHVELNYISARKGNKLFVAFTNQSPETVACNVTWDTALIERTGAPVKIRYWQDNRFSREQGLPDRSHSWPVKVSPGGITVVEITGVEMKTRVQDKLLQAGNAWQEDYREINFGNARAMIFNLGELGKRAYVYLKDDDNVFRDVSLTYWDGKGESRKITDNAYPFEFTVPLGSAQADFRFQLGGKLVNGNSVEGKVVVMKADSPGK